MAQRGSEGRTHLRTSARISVVGLELEALLPVTPEGMSRNRGGEVPPTGNTELHTEDTVRLLDGRAAQPHRQRVVVGSIALAPQAGGVLGVRESKCPARRGPPQSRTRRTRWGEDVQAVRHGKDESRSRHEEHAHIVCPQ